MKRGDTVTIYGECLKEEDPWGEAKLLRLEIEDMGWWEGRRLQYWRVRFADGEVTECKVLEPLLPRHERVALLPDHP